MSKELLTRYEVRHGKWGAYHYDLRMNKALTLEDVTQLLNKLHEIELCKLGKSLAFPER